MVLTRTILIVLLLCVVVADGAEQRQVPLQLVLQVVQPGAGPGGPLDLPARLQRDRSPGRVQADQVIAFEDLRAHGDEKAAKAAGVYRLEGKDYVVRDGDVIRIDGAAGTVSVAVSAD